MDAQDVASRFTYRGSNLNNQSKGAMHASRWHAVIAAGVFAAGLCLAATTATATPITINASTGGVPTGSNYENFDDLIPGSTGGSTSSGIVVQFEPNGQAVQGSSSGQYAAPYLSNGNGALFGNSADGQDTTTYLTTGTGSVTLLFPTAVRYLGLLWGSVDGFNSLAFYMGGDLIQTITGADITIDPNGDQGVEGTFYVNINSLVAFDRVIASSTSNAFEFDNVAYNVAPIGVPEPGAAGIFLLGLLLVGSSYWLKGRRLS